MLERSGCRLAPLQSGRRRGGFQSLLVLSVVLGSYPGSLLLGSSDSKYGQIPLTFVANRGQVHNSVRFTARGPGYTAYFTPSEVVVDVRSTIVRMRYLAANVSSDVVGVDIQEGKANYLIGNDPGKWQTNVPLFGSVVYKDLYPGIDMLYSSSARQLKSTFAVAPGADPSYIQIEYRGVEALRIDQQGGLIFTTPDGELREAAPEMYQETSGRRDIVSGAFQISGKVVSFAVGEYDRSRELKIDPALSYSTYLGGSGTNKGTAIAVDASGAAYVTGYTDSTNFPVSGGVVESSTGGGVDVFVTKLNGAGNAIVYSTYLGGSGDDRGFSIAVDGAGNAYVTGWTGSTNFPVAAAVQGSAGGGGRDAFVAKLNSTGTGLIYSTYLGGSGSDSGNGIAIDASGAYVTGSTTSNNFPVANAFQALPGGGQDGFVTKLNAAGSAIVYSTYLGGSLDDRGSSIAVDSSGAAYVTGNTSSTNFPTVSALQAANGGAPDAFVTKLSASGSSAIYSTYLGGSGVENMELGRSIAVDSSNNAYVTGTTFSSNFPTFQPLQPSLSGSNDAFVVKLNAAGSAFVYSTYLGGSSIDYGESIAVDGSGIAYVAGYTASPDFPSVNADQPANAGSFDAFIAKLNTSGSALTDTDFLGGSGTDAGYGIALDSAVSAYVTGQTSSSNFPLKTPAQGSLGTSGLAAFVAKFTFGTSGPPTAVSVSPPGSSGASQTFTLVYSDTLGFADISWVEMNWNATQSTAGACYLHYDRAGNTIQLSNDAGNGWVGSLKPTLAGTLQNSQCILDAGASSVFGSGNNLTLNLALTFKQAFAGTKNIYMQVQNVSSALTPWQARGTWIVTTTGPTNVSVAPASGSGASQIFSFVFSDASGYADINWVQMIVGPQVISYNVCFVTYTRATNVLQLVVDAGGTFVGSGATLGVPGTLTNSQCTLNAGASSVSGSGSNLTVNLSLTFKPVFAGAKGVFSGVVNNASVFSGWQAMGAWTATAANSIMPASGSGSSQTFSFVFSDASGYTDINWVQMIVGPQVMSTNVCFVTYTRATNVLQLVVDAGGTFVGSGATLGVPGTLTNSQCILDAGASSVSGSGSSLTVNVALTFKPAFAGAKGVFSGMINNANVFFGWQPVGSWTTNLPPANISVTPASGSGSSQTFSFVFSDASGYADINWVQMIVGPQVMSNNVCFVTYTRATNVLQLVVDAGGTFVGSGATLGVPGTLTNSQCTLDAGASSVSGSGSSLTVNVALTFKPAFAGAKGVFSGVISNANEFSGWQAMGSWTTN
jgi:hypothetical protein